MRNTIGYISWIRPQVHADLEVNLPLNGAPSRHQFCPVARLVEPWHVSHRNYLSSSRIQAPPCRYLSRLGSRSGSTISKDVLNPVWWLGGKTTRSIWKEKQCPLPSSRKWWPWWYIKEPLHFGTVGLLQLIVQTTDGKNRVSWESRNRGTINPWGTDDASELKRVKLLVENKSAYLSAFAAQAAFGAPPTDPVASTKLKLEHMIWQQLRTSEAFYRNPTFAQVVSPPPLLSHTHTCLINNKCEPFPSPSYSQAFLYTNAHFCSPLQFLHINVEDR